MRTMLQGHFSGALIHQIERLFQHGTVSGLTEGELLERFVRGHDESAFEALIARHGPMVLGVCRQLLRDPNDVDDAFQATFLVLVRKAGTLRRHDLLGNWLYGVAYRVATRARVLAARRLAKSPYGHEAVGRLDEGCRRLSGQDEAASLDLEPRPWLHEEVGRLPEKYRVPVLLCYFEGLTHEEAAGRLGWPLGTVKGRLARARDLLRRRLTRRGLTLSPAALASHLAVPDLKTAVPASLEYATLRAAQAVARTAGASITTVAAVSLPVAALTQGALRAMTMTQAKAFALPLLVIGAVTAGVVIGATQSAPSETETGTPGQQTVTESTPSKARPNSPKTYAEKAKRSASSSPSKKAHGPDTQGAAGPEGGVVGGMGGMMGGGMAGYSGMMGQMMGRQAMMGGGAMMEEAGAREAVEFQNRLEIAQLAAALTAIDKNLQNQAILKRLEEPISMSFGKAAPLDDVLKYIKQATTTKTGSGIPIYVDPQGLKDAEVTQKSTVIIDLEGIPLKTSLRLILKQLGLAYCVRDGVLIISSVQGIREELAEAARELLGSGNEEISMPMLNQMGILGRGGMGFPAGRMGGRGLQ